MADDRWAVYDGFSDKGAHLVEWFEIVKNFLKLDFAGDHREVKSMCNRCRNRMILSEYEMSDHIAKQELMSNYLVWHQHGEVLAPATDELNENDDDDRMERCMHAWLQQAPVDPTEFKLTQKFPNFDKLDSIQNGAFMPLKF
jgi:hypothetical protein